MSFLTKKEQQKFFKQVDSKFWSPLFERIVSSKYVFLKLPLLTFRIALALMNGVPKPQANLLEKEGGIAVFLRKVFKWLMTGTKSTFIF